VLLEIKIDRYWVTVICASLWP